MMAWLDSIGIGDYYARLYAWYIAILCGGWLVGWWYRRRWPRAMTAVLRIVLVILAVRLVAFDNPIALRFYERQLTSSAIGARQRGALNRDIEKYRRRVRQPPLSLLAVGSSQVGAIFSHWPRTPNQPMEVFSLAGMKTLDYELYRDEIVARNPVRVLLYLSAFDLTAAPELASLSLAPAHPTRIGSVLARVRHGGVPYSVMAGPAHAYVASQLLPEYRYGFVFRGLLKDAIEQRPFMRALHWVLPPLHAASPQATAEEPAQPRQTPGTTVSDINRFASYYRPEWLDYNMLFLRSFVEFCRTRGVEVVIVEGQVNPVVMNARLETLNAFVRSRVAELALLYPNVRIIQAHETYVFSAQEYADFTHVHVPAARQYTQQLAAWFARIIPPPLSGTCDIGFVGDWYGREARGDDWLRWSNGTGRLRLRSAISGTYVLRGRILSLRRPNVVRVIAGTQELGRLEIADPAWAFHEFDPITVEMHAGEDLLLDLVSEAPPIRQVADTRPLTYALSNVSLSGPDSSTCSVLH